MPLEDEVEGLAIAFNCVVERVVVVLIAFGFFHSITGLIFGAGAGAG